MKFLKLEMTSGSSKLVQNELLGSQMTTQGVVLETNEPQVWSGWTSGRPLGVPRVAKGRPRVDFGRPKGAKGMPKGPKKSPNRGPKSKKLRSGANHNKKTNRSAKLDVF